MKTAISIPDALFDTAETFARQNNLSRSELYCRALREYLASHSPDEVTAAVDRVCDGLTNDSGEFRREASRRSLGRVE